MKKIFHILTILTIFSLSLISCNEVGEEDDTTEEGCYGEMREFWIWDLSVMPPEDILISSVCIGEGDHEYIYVDTSFYGTEVDDEDVFEYLRFLEEETPSDSIDPTSGIVDNNIALFGDIPDAIDGDPKFYILVTDLASFGGSSFDGYFNVYDQYPDGTYSYRSNEVEILYIDGYDKKLTSEEILSVTAHELQHMIHWNYDEDEEIWLNEAMSELAMVINGYYTDTAYVKDYLKDPSTPLIVNDYVHYGACLLFGVYFYERYGDDMVSSLIQIEKNGIEGIDALFEAEGLSENFVKLFLDWTIANYLDDPDVQDGRFSYSFADIPSVKEFMTFDNFNESISNREMEASGVDYILFEMKESDVSVEIEIEDAGDSVVYIGIISSGEDIEVEDWIEAQEGSNYILLPSCTTEYILVLTSLSDWTYSMNAYLASD